MKRLFRFRSTPVIQELATSEDAPNVTCVRCGAGVSGRPRYERFRVCDACGFHFAIDARRRIDSLIDPGTFRETHARLYSTDPLGFVDDLPYRERLEQQRLATGQADAMTTGTAAIHGRQVVLAVLDFAFMGGSMGVVVGEKLVRATELARERRSPLITIVASGGARMQEGMFSLLQMAKTAAAIRQLQRSGLLYVSVLAHPTTGGVFASFANLGDVILAEPEALIGFAGPRVVEQFLGKPLPPGSHSAEFLVEHGMIDEVVDRVKVRGRLGGLFDVVAPRARSKPSERMPTPPRVIANERRESWTTVLGARAPERPTAVETIERICERFVELHGDRESGEDPAVVAGLGRLGGRPVAVVGLERGRGETAEWRRHGRPMPEGYRKAQRVMRLAARLDVPVVTLVDTPGAYPGIEAEERGLAGEIAETMALMSELAVPIVSAVIGEGGSGGALALAVADRVLMQEGAIYSVIAPEGAAAILYRDGARAPELAQKLKITANDLRSFGIVDEIVPEPVGGAAADPDLAASYLRAELLLHLEELCGMKRERLIQTRYDRYRAIGRSRVVSAVPKMSGKSGPREAEIDGSGVSRAEPAGGSAG